MSQTNHRPCLTILTTSSPGLILPKSVTPSSSLDHPRYFAQQSTRKMKRQLFFRILLESLSIPSSSLQICGNLATSTAPIPLPTTAQSQAPSVQGTPSSLPFVLIAAFILVPLLSLGEPSRKVIPSGLDKASKGSGPLLGFAREDAI